MIRRLWLLLRKEARHQAWLLLAMAVALLAIGGLRWFFSRQSERAPSDIEGAQALILLFVPLAALVLGHRVVVREYQARTQLFLEALPLRRSELLAVKYAFGLGVLCAFSWSAIGLVALLVGEHSLRFLGILILRSLGFAGALWTLFFSFGLLGRLRVPAYVTLGFGVLALGYVTSFDIKRFGPFDLINDVAFSYDRTSVPWRAFAESAAVCGALLIPGLFLALASEGSLVENLARRATGREVTAVSVLLFAEFIGVLWAGSKRKPPPFEFTSAEVVKSPDRRVAIMYAFHELEPKARELVRALEALGVRAREQLALDEWQPLSIAENSLLAGNEVHHSPNSGEMVMFEANLGAQDFTASIVLRDALHTALIHASAGNASFEPNHWLLDGFSTLLALETTGEDPKSQWLSALVAVRHWEASPRNIAQWEQAMERLGEMQSGALAFTLVDFLRQRHGRAHAIELGRALLVEPAERRPFAWLRPGAPPPIEQRFQEITGEPLASFISAFRAELARRARDPVYATTLATIPDDAAELSVKTGSLGPEIHYAVSGIPLQRERRCLLLHGLLRPYDIFYSSQLLTREPFRVEPNASRAEGQLRGRYSTGQRVYAAIECEVPELGMRQRLRVQRFGGQ